MKLCFISEVTKHNVYCYYCMEGARHKKFPTHIKEQCEHSARHLPLCFTEESKSYGLGTTGSLKVDRFFTFGWTNLLNGCFWRSEDEGLCRSVEFRGLPVSLCTSCFRIMSWWLFSKFSITVYSGTAFKGWAWNLTFSVLTHKLSDIFFSNCKAHDFVVLIRRCC